MGTLLRLAGAGLFVAMLFLPGLEGCGVTRTECQLASERRESSASLGFVGALLLGAFAAVGVFKKKVSAVEESIVILGAMAAMGGTIWLISEARRMGAVILWPMWAQIGGAALMMVGGVLGMRGRSREK